MKRFTVYFKIALDGTRRVAADSMEEALQVARGYDLKSLGLKVAVLDELNDWSVQVYGVTDDNEGD